MSRAIADLSRTRWIIALLVCAGLAERIAWNIIRPGWGAAGEAMNVAVALGQGRGFADAFRPGQGPTAHLLPISPGLAGAIYGLLGVRSIAAEIILAGWSIGLAIGTYLLLFKAFGYLGMPRRLRLIALAYGCIAPAYISQEAVEFRVWEGGLAVFLGAWFLERLLAADVAARAGLEDRALSRRVGVAGIIASLLFFVNPPLGASAALCLIAFGMRRLSFRGNARAASWALIALAALVVPWTLRNEAVFGHFVPLRSNAGLEIAVGNYPGAADALDGGRNFQDHIERIHPTLNAQAYRFVRERGEIAYAQMMGAAASHWMTAHPVEVARLTLAHATEMVKPSGWKFDVKGTSLRARAKIYSAGAAGLLGLCGLLIALYWRLKGVGYPAFTVIFTILIFSPFQPAARYTYLIYPLSVYFMACVGLPLTNRRSLPVS